MTMFSSWPDWPTGPRWPNSGCLYQPSWLCQRKCVDINDSQLAKMEKKIPTCLCHKIHRVEAVGLSLFNYILKITIFVNMWNVGLFRENLKYFVSNCLIKFRIYRYPSAPMWPVQLWLSAAHHISFLLNQFSVEYRFPFPILRSYRKIT